MPIYLICPKFKEKWVENIQAIFENWCNFKTNKFFFKQKILILIWRTKKIN